MKKGSKTVWNDNCEYDGIEDRNAFCEFEGMGGTMAELKIIHSNMMAYTAKEALAEVYPEERPYIINRAGFAGIQRYAQVWDGDNLTDWRTVKFNIATIMGMGNVRVLPIPAVISAVLQVLLRRQNFFFAGFRTVFSSLDSVSIPQTATIR